MDRIKQQPRIQRRTRMKNRGSQTCSSSDEDFHSDDNLRPYEEVKIAHHDKKLAGLGELKILELGMWSSSFTDTLNFVT